MSLITLLQAAPAAGAAGQQGGGLSMWIMLILIFVVMWVFMIMPQRKQQKKMEEFRKSLKKGDKVVTAGGIYGTIAEVSDNEKTVLLKVDGDVKLRVDKASLQRDFSESDAQQTAEKK
ncbi:MAG: preprotein translocase subunit YajC [Bacteroidales bacterium]|nr:preprotein translocase subunit YajC [Bacteroidales bacterium]